MISLRPDLPDWGIYARWPADGEAWVHPDDRELARRLLPSRRIWRRNRWDGQYYWLQYGPAILRVQPTMWRRVPDCDLDVGQQVELLERHGKNDRGIYRIAELLHSDSSGSLEILLTRGTLAIARAFSRADLRPIEEKYNLRSGFYSHSAPKSSAADDVDRLDVGDLGEPS